MSKHTITTTTAASAASGDQDAEADVDAETLDQQLRSLELTHSVPGQPGRTILPSPIAAAVSLATRSGCLAIRVGSAVGSYGFDAARVTTLSSLELGRGILEGILSRAGRDMVTRSRSDLARADAETILESSLENLHRAMSQVVFWTTTGFHVTGTTFSMFSEITQLLLSALDQFFGSTESSRAIASIITLIRREFQNPATGIDGQQVGVVDLVMGLSALAYLQRRCWKLEDEESRRLGHEEIVWDVVVLTDGERVDVHEDSLYGTHKGRYRSRGPGILISQSGLPQSPSIMTTFDDGSRGDEDQADDEDAPEMRLRNQIMQSLPADTSVSISTSVVTQKTITVDFSGPEPSALTPPPGIEIVEREIIPMGQQSHELTRQAPSKPSDAPMHRVVYKVDRTQTNTVTCQGHGEVPNEPPQPLEAPGPAVELIDSADESDHSPLPSPTSHPRPEMDEKPCPTPPKRVSSAYLKVRTNHYPPVLRKPSLPNLSRPAASRTTSGRTSKTAQRPQAESNPDNAPNQKRQRKPLAPLADKQREGDYRRSSSVSNKLLPPKPKPEPTAEPRSTQKKSGLRQAFRKGAGSNISNLWNKEPNSSMGSVSSGREKKPPRPAVPEKTTRPLNHIPQAYSRATGPTIASNLRERDWPESANIPRSESRASYISVHERRRDSIVSQTDTYSLHSVDDLRSASPIFARKDPRTTPGTSRIPLPDINAENSLGSPAEAQTRRFRPRGHAPSLSLYSIATNGSQTSLVLSSMHPKSAYTDSEAIDTLRRAGTLDGIFPRFHLLRNVTRFMLFSSASYGSNFLKVMGISKGHNSGGALDDTHHEIRSFAQHTESHTDSILLASFVDPQGGSDTTGSTGTGVPLVHYISLDHESKAVVLACRGTLGFEDVLADLACEYDDLVWRGKRHKVHKGVHASARRLLYGGDGRVLYTLKEALDEFSDYGLVLCGHSLGGAVTSLLGTMLAEPSPTGTGFVTSAEPHRRLLTNGPGAATAASSAHVCLPSGRPIHVYAYGPPGTMSPSLRKATRGLITSTVHGNDLVPFLSLGVLHDFQAAALAFKNDGATGGPSDPRLEVKQRIWQAFQTGLAEKWYAGGTGTGAGAGRSSSGDGTVGSVVGGDDTWAIAALTTLRAGMTNQKLVPPGEIFVVESSRVLRRDAFLLADQDDLVGRPARRVVLKYVRDVESRFREVRFGTSMLMDHSPANYEQALRMLRLGVADAG